MKQPERELPLAAAAFNLITETSEDGFRVMMEKLREAERQAEARSYQLRMQRTFEGCPGFIEGDAPQSEQASGSVTVKPESLMEALPWLKRRFYVADTFEARPAAGGLSIEVKPKVKKAPGVKRSKPSFAPAEQFTLALPGAAPEEEQTPAKDGWE